MDISKTKQLFDEYIDKTRFYQEKFQAQQEFIKNNEEPKMKDRYESLEEFAEYQQRVAQWKAQSEHLLCELRMAEAARDNVGSAIKDILPQEVWFRHGNVGIGISYTNWGGSSISIEVKPWQDKMPSLNHRYAGD